MSRVGASRECPACREQNYAGVCVSCGFAEPEEGEGEPHPPTPFKMNRTQRELSTAYGPRRRVL